MTYQYSIAELATMQQPSSATHGTRYDYIGDHIALALAERVEAMVTAAEALVAAVETLNGYLATLAQIGPKLDKLVEATRGKAP